MIYKNYYQYDDIIVGELLKSSDPQSLIDGLLFTVLGGQNYNQSNELIKRLLTHPNTSVQSNAVLCIGHLVRIYKTIDLEGYLPILNKIIQEDIDHCVDNAERSIEDIWINFQQQEEKKVKKDNLILHSVINLLENKEFRNYRLIQEALHSDYTITRFIAILALGNYAGDQLGRYSSEFQDIERNDLNQSVRKIARTFLDTIELTKR